MHDELHLNYFVGVAQELVHEGVVLREEPFFTLGILRTWPAWRPLQSALRGRPTVSSATSSNGDQVSLGWVSYQRMIMRHVTAECRRCICCGPGDGERVNYAGGCVVVL